MFLFLCIGLGNLAGDDPVVTCSCGETFWMGNQRKIMGKVVDHLIEANDLYDVATPPLAPVQAQKNALISENRIHSRSGNTPDRNIQGEWKLVTGDFLNTTYRKEDKQRYLGYLAEGVGVELEFGEWPSRG